MRGLRRKLKLLEDSDFGIINKKEIKIMSEFKKNYNKRNTKLPAPDVCAGLVEYQMSKTMADEIIKASKSKKTPQEILCNYVNSECGLKGYCIRVLVDVN